MSEPAHDAAAGAGLPGELPPDTAFVETSTKVELVSTKIVTVPNVLTSIRILMIPVFLWLLATGTNDAAAAILLGVISLTDFFDGKIARRYNQVTELGKMLDPIADRLLIVAAAIGLIWRGILPLPLALLILSREVVVSIVSIQYKARGVQLEVRYVGKWAAALVFASIPAFLLGYALGDPVQIWLDALGWICGVVGSVLGYVAIGYYIVDGNAAIRRHHAAETGAQAPAVEESSE